MVHCRTVFFGIKNDTDRSGAEVTLFPSQVPRLDPVGALHCYTERTATSRAATMDNAVFLTLRVPFHAITATAVASILDDAIEGAGLAGQGFSAKSFRPTGATVGIGSGQSQT